MRSQPFFALILGLSLGFPAVAAEPKLETSNLFEAGKGGYALYRIPGIVVTPKGTILAYCEARKTARSDWTTIDILCVRSTDGGKTWSAPEKVAAHDGKHTKNPVAIAQKLANPDDVTFNNAAMIVEPKTGAVHLLYCLEYMRCFHRRSDDDGKTWSAPVEITGTFDGYRDSKEYAWKVIATGPAHGIALKSGRLVVPIWMSTGTGGHGHRPSVVATIFSDDSGKTWKRGEIAATETDPLRNPNETVIVELSDGRVMLNIRSESKEHRRATTVSPDGATKWTKPTFDEALTEPICMASIVRLDGKRIVFANPDNLERAAGKATPGQSRDRKNLTVRISSDDAKTWESSRVIEPGFAGYSDLAVTPDGTILCFFERGSNDGKNSYLTKFLTLARFNPEWVTTKP